MGLRAVLDANKLLQEGIGAAGTGIAQGQEAGLRREEIERKRAADQRKKEALEGLQPSIDALNQAAADPDFDINQFADLANPIAQIATEFESPGTFQTATAVPSMVLAQRRAAAAEQAKTDRDASKTKRQKTEDRRKARNDLINQRKNNETTKRTNSMREAIKKIETSGSKGTGPGDLALIFNFMKLLDPGSVVRESEFRSAAELRSWFSREITTDENGNMVTKSGKVLPSALIAAKQKADAGAKGAFLLPDQRKAFVDEAGSIFEGQLGIQVAEDDAISGRAADDDVDPSKVISVFAAKELEERKAAREKAASAAEKVKQRAAGAPSDNGAEKGRVVLGADALMKNFLNHGDNKTRIFTRVQEIEAARGSPLNAAERMQALDDIIESVNRKRQAAGKTMIVRDPNVTLQELGLDGGL